MAHWLFKTEPGCFSFDDLKTRPDMTEPWDGVRNFQARNFLRDTIQPGDMVLFYHSNIAAPAVVGLAEIVRSGYPDTTALNPNSEHFDPKATAERPIWYMVDVRYVELLPRAVTLERIKQNPLLTDMPLVKRSRLSIQPVTEAEWRIILTMGGMEERVKGR
ncbi:MAG: EVE domain-containing protein [Desulfuromonadaceae bacterium]|nr:EVE domain-containing protein [Desulfuromonadaceae bacterium]